MENKKKTAVISAAAVTVILAGSLIFAFSGGKGIGRNARKNSSDAVSSSVISVDTDSAYSASDKKVGADDGDKEAEKLDSLNNKSKKTDSESASEIVPDSSRNSDNKNDSQSKSDSRSGENFRNDNSDVGVPEPDDSDYELPLITPDVDSDSSRTDNNSSKSDSDGGKDSKPDGDSSRSDDSFDESVSEGNGGEIELPVLPI